MADALATSEPPRICSLSMAEYLKDPCSKPSRLKTKRYGLIRVKGKRTLAHRVAWSLLC